MTHVGRAESTSGMLITQCTRILKEAFEGPPGPWSYFTERAPAPGLLGTLEQLPARDASRPLGPNGSTIAGHVQHLLTTLDIYRAWIRGEAVSPVSKDRTRSWTVTAVDDAQWRKIQQALRAGYTDLTLTIETQSDWSEDAIGGTLGAIAHIGYHIGAIRQRIIVTSQPF
ncbi:MAG TPA: DinB family protein [Gemmatimonadales bacterium]|nr:DinB family protein [Gemmatimonadales bacterium]